MGLQFPQIDPADHLTQWLEPRLHSYAVYELTSSAFQLKQDQPESCHAHLRKPPSLEEHLWADLDAVDLIPGEPDQMHLIISEPQALLFQLQPGND